MPIHPTRVLLASLLVLPFLALSAPSHAASYPNVLYRPGIPNLPDTPAYRSGAITRSLQLISTSHTNHTVNVVVDSAVRLTKLRQYATAVSNPKGPLFQRFLSPSQFNSLYGPTPAMIRQAESRMEEAGWHVVGRQGLVVTAVIPKASRHPGLPVSPDIWSMTDFAPHGFMRNLSLSRKALGTTTTPSMAAEDLNQPPNVIQQTTESNGDVVSIMSWNALVAGEVPAGLPINLFVTVQDPQGNFLPIQNVTNLNDSDQSLVSYGPNAMPHNSNTLWQVPIAAWQDILPGDLLTLQAILPSGVALNASFPLPEFTGPATVLSPLDAQQLNTLSGMGSMPSNPGAIALFAIGSPPSLKDLSLYLKQNTNGATNSPTVTFQYEDGAVASESGQQADSEESQLDLEAAAGAAPGAPIIDYIFPENDSNDPLISYLTDLSQQSVCKVADVSYGFFGEDASTLNTLMNALTVEGITVTEASGDQGAWNAGNDPGPVGLSSLEQVPSVLSVGGVDLAAAALTDGGGNTTAITGSIISDAWGGDFLNGIPVAVAQAYTNENAASSGGYSTSTPIPSWQTGFLPANASGFGVPIISSLAGSPGMNGFLQGQNVIFGGTSLAAPLTAGWLVELEAALGTTSKGMGNVNPLIFQAAVSSPSIFTQALWGQDGYYSVTTSQSGSWNPLTGLGMLNWGQFMGVYNSLVPASSPTATLAAAPDATVGKTDLISAYVRGLINPLFQFSYRSPQNRVWTTSGPFSSLNNFNWRAKVPGVYIIRVKAKDASGHTATSQITLIATTRAPMVSALTIRSSLKTRTTLALGGTLTIWAHATDIGSRPEYQFLLSGPQVVRHIVRGWSPNHVFALDHLTPGRYAITIDALDRAEIVQHNWAAAYRATLRFLVK